MIKLKQVQKIFDQRGIAGIRHLDLNIPRGSIFALMGSNGSGKTTLLNLMSGNLPADAGTIELKGSVHFFKTRAYEKELNVQRFLIEAITLDIDTDKKIQLSRDLANIFEFTFQLRQNMGQLSQGQLQKVLMAAELIDKPNILFLDEPFIHLDPMSRKEILVSLFEYLKQNEVTVVWITHEKDEALRFADQVGLLQHGRMEQVGAPIDILNKPGNLFVAQYFGHQNFLKINRLEAGWTTPWGIISSPLNDHEGYLIVPPTAWKIDESSPFEGEILKIYPQYFVCELELLVNEKCYLVSLPLAAFEQLKPKQKLKISPDLEHCLVISL